MNRRCERASGPCIPPPEGGTPNNALAPGPSRQRAESSNGPDFPNALSTLGQKSLEFRIDAARALLHRGRAGIPMAFSGAQPSPALKIWTTCLCFQP